MDEESLGVRRPEFRIQTGLVFPEGRALESLLRRKLPVRLFTLESCLDLGVSGILSVYLRRSPCPSSSKLLSSVGFELMASVGGRRYLSSFADKEVVVLRNSGDEGTVRERGAARLSGSS